MKYPLVSIIVTNYNGLKYLKPCFDSLLKQTYKNIELIMADDCSTDDSVSYVRKNYPMVKIAESRTNGGLSINSNNGRRLSKGKYLLFHNNDTVSSPDFVEEMVAVAEKDRTVGVVCPIQLPYRKEDDAKMNEFQKDIGTGSDMYGYVCPAMWAGSIFYPDACIFMRADIFDHIGGFDPDFRLYGEDMDLCWRVHLLGYKIKPALKAIFRHDSFCAQKEGGKVITSYKRRHLVERQVINKLFKYYKVKTLSRLLPRFIFFYTLESFYFLIIQRNPKAFWEIYVKAIVWNLQRIKSTIEEREYIQKIRKVDDKYILSLMYPKYDKLDAVRVLGVPKIR